jgi:hypothetical protein
LSGDTQAPMTLSWKRESRGKGAVYYGFVPLSGPRPTRKSVQAAIARVQMHMQRHGLVRGVSYRPCERVDDDNLVVITIQITDDQPLPKGQTYKRFDYTAFQRQLDGDAGITYQVELVPMTVSGASFPAAELAKTATEEKPSRDKTRRQVCPRRVALQH